MKIVNVKKKLVDKSVDECDKTVDEVKIVSEGKNKRNSCILYIVLFSIFFIINVGIATSFVYYKYVNRNKKMFLNMIMFIKQKIINMKCE